MNKLTTDNKIDYWEFQLDIKLTPAERKEVKSKLGRPGVTIRNTITGVVNKRKKRK